jgi:mono/diheme cytochrome c family protein
MGMGKQLPRIVIALSLAVFAAGCGSGKSEPESKSAANEPNTGEYAAAMAAYKQSCVSCHGGELQGKVGPGLQKAGAKFTEQQLVDILTKGRGGMPAFKGRLSDSQIEELAVWLATKK